MSTSTDGGLTWSTPIADGRPRQGPRRAAGRAAERARRRAVREPERHDLVLHVRRRRRARGATASRSRASASTALRATSARARCRRAEIAGDGTVYVAWEDCRFRTKCASNDIVFSTSTDGVDLDRPGAGPDRSRHEHGRSLHPRPRGRPGDARGRHPPRADLLLLPDRQLQRRPAGSTVGYISSPDGGAHWGSADPAGRADGARRHRPDVAGTDGRRLHLDVVRPAPAPRPSSRSACRTRPARRSTRRCTRRRRRWPSRRRPRPTNAASTAGVVGPVTGVGTGETHHDPERLTQRPRPCSRPRLRAGLRPVREPAGGDSP